MTIRRAIGIVPLLLLLLAATPSPGPSPRPPAQHQAEQAEGVKADTNSEANKTVGSAVPKEAVPSPDLHNPARNGARYTNSKKPWYGTTAGLLAAFTLVLAIATAFLAIFTRQLVAVTRQTHHVVEGIERVARDSAAAMASGLEIARQNAEDTRQSITIAKTTADAAASAAGTAHATLMLNMAARLVIHVGPAVVPEHSQPTFVHFVVANVGRTPATITGQVFCTVFAFPDMPFPPLPPIDWDTANKPLPALMAGGHCPEATVRVRALSEDAAKGRAGISEWRHWSDDRLWLLFVGRVEYTDDLGGEHVTAICRGVQRSRTGEFIKPPGLPASYDYET